MPFAPARNNRTSDGSPEPSGPLRSAARHHPRRGSVLVVRVGPAPALPNRPLVVIVPGEVLVDELLANAAEPDGRVGNLLHVNEPPALDVEPDHKDQEAADQRPQ